MMATTPCSELRRATDPMMTGSSGAGRAVTHVVLALSSAALLVSCGVAECTSGTDCKARAVSVTTAFVIVTPSVDTITVGATALKRAVPQGLNPTPATGVRWSSNAAAIARVDSLTGVVTGVALGAATITARTDSSGSGTAAVVVTTSTTPASILVAPANPSVQVGRFVALSASAFSASALPVTATFRWSSAAPAVASVDSINGLVSGTGVGSALITVRTVPASVTNSVSVVVTAAVAGGGIVAELPRVFLNTSYAPPTGAQIVVAVGGNLQTALSSAAAGDEILLAPGGVYTGNFTLPAKGGSGVVHIRTNVPYASLPPEGQRMTPAIAAALNLARIQSSNGGTVIQTGAGASNYRIVGVEVTVGSATALNSLMRTGDVAQTSLTNVSTNIVFDRIYAHGTATNDLTRGIILSSASTAIIDSYFADFHTRGADSQALVGWNGPGPYKIVNNYLEASSENINWGGSDPGVPQLIPSDIEIRRNHFNKPASWDGGPWLIKNLYESKSSQRVLIEGNIFSGNWQNGQVGYAINLKSTNQGGACTWCATKDQTFRYNRITNTGAGFGIAGAPDPFPVDSTARRIVIQDNIVDNVNVGIYRGVAAFLQTIGAASDIVVDHNTFVSSGIMNTSLSVSGTTPAVVALKFTNNVIGNTAFGVKGGGTGEGTGTLTAFCPGSIFQKNLLVGVPQASYPAGNYFATNVGAVGFSNFALGDYLLVGAIQPQGSDNRTVGADIAVVNAKTNGVIVP